MIIETAMLQWLHDNGTPEAVKVVRYEEDEDERGGCAEGTCTWDITVVRMYYLDKDGNEDCDWYEGEMSEFINELTGYEDVVEG